MNRLNSYNEDGTLKGSMKMKPPVPTRIQWEFSSQMLATIDEAYNDGLQVVTVSRKRGF